MGLAGRKQKQRIGADPRNLSWADDAAKFGQAYLSKMGWDPSQGLGVSGEGRTTHIKVAQKLNLLGVGAGNARMGEDNVAWKQNREYEILLKRLNAGPEEGAADDGDDAAKDVNVVEGEGVKERKDKDKKKKKKRKRNDDDDDDGVQAGDDIEGNKESSERKKKKERKEKKQKEKKQKEPCVDDSKNTETINDKQTSEAVNPSSSTTSVIQSPTPRPMAHRARFLRSKQLASRDSTAVAEILGISSSGAASPSTGTPFLTSLSATPFPPSSASATPGPETDQELRTASTTVGDYFKEKLASRALLRGKTSSVPPPSEPDSSDLIVQRSSNANAEDDAPRTGLGSQTFLAQAPRDDVKDASCTGLGIKFGGLMGGLAFSGSSPTSHSPNQSIPPEKKEDSAAQSIEDKEDDAGKAEREKKKKRKNEGEVVEKTDKKKKGKRKQEEPTEMSVDVETRRVEENIDTRDADLKIGIEQKENAEGKKEKKKRRKEKGSKRKRAES